MALEKIVTKPAILCLHGRGTSAMIFEMQAMQLVRLLENRFTFIFVDAPIESEPGPGVLPIFEDEGPYYSWLKDTPLEMPVDTELEATMLMLEELQVSHLQVVGILGFSQGAAVGLGLLLRDQRRREIGLPPVGYRFGAFIGGGTLPLIMNHGYNDSSANLPVSDGHSIPEVTQIEIPTLHAAGNNDPFAKQGSALQNWVKNQRMATSFEFTGRHELPRREEDIMRLASEIVKIYEESQRN